jgi:hypothetical protein
MIPVYQTIFTAPGGNCLQACLASIFELPLEEVPHFAAIETDDWWEQCQAWCITHRGVYPIFWPGQHTEGICGYHLIAGKTVNGHDHVVVGCNGQAVHDPIPDGFPMPEITGCILFMATLDR